MGCPRSIVRQEGNKLVRYSGCPKEQGHIGSCLYTADDTVVEKEVHNAAHERRIQGASR